MKKCFTNFLEANKHYLIRVKAFKFKSSILFFLCLYSFVLLITLFYYGYLNSVKVIEYKKNMEVEAITSDLKKTVQIFDNEIAKLTDFAEFIYKRYAKDSNPEKLKEITDTALELNKEISDISICDVSKNSIYSSNDSFNKDMTEVIKESKRDTVLILDNTNTPDFDLSFTRVFKKNNGKNVYGISFLQHVEKIKGILDELMPYKERTIIFIDQAGTMMIVNGSEKLNEKNLEGNNIMQRLTNTSGSFTVSVNKEKVDVFYVKSTDFNYSLLVMTTGLDSGKRSVTVISFMVYSSLGAILIVISIFYLFKRKIYSPIINIEKAMNGIVQGDMEFQFDINKNNELYKLADSLNSMVARLKDLINREYNAKILKKQAELNALQSQINPHFLYNTLDSIRGQALREGIESIEQMTRALSSLFRYSISHKDNLVSFGDELKNVDNYVMIQQFRFNNKFKVIKKIEDADENILDYKIPKLSIQPIVENAIYHGLEAKVGEGTITIRAYTTEKRLIISIKDDGVGIAQDKLETLNDSLTIGKDELLKDRGEEKSRIALLNVNERIKLFFGDDYGIVVYSTLGQGTTLEIVLPLIKDE